MKKKFLVGALALSIGVSSTAYGVKDIDSHWAKEDINYLIEANIMAGYEDESFQPDRYISRAEFLKIINGVYKNEKTSQIDFKDVDKKDWFYEDISKGVGAGYVEGYDDKTFRPNQAIDRQEAAKLLVLAAGMEDKKPAKKLNFKDQSDINKWAEDYVAIMVEKGYINGYEDQTFRPKRGLSRGEAAKILARLSREEEEKNKDKDKDKDEEVVTKPEEDLVYSIQLDSFKDEKEALKEGSKLLKAGYKNTFIARDNYGIYYLIVDDYKEEDKAEKLKLELENKGFKPVLSKKDFKQYEIIRPKLEEPVKTDLDKLEEAIGKLPEAKSIDRLTEGLLRDMKNLDQDYNKLNDLEKSKLSSQSRKKWEAVSSKIESLKTNIESASKTSVESAQAWARSRGAHARFIDIAPVYWEYGELTGINPEILYAQAAKETNFGKYTGSVKPEMNNWAGIKTDNPSGDKTYDHEIFPTPEDGVRAQFNHMGIYVGVEPIGEPHPRWYVTSKVSWRGQVKKVEDLGGKWAPSLDYGISIMRDYVNQIYKF